MSAIEASGPTAVVVVAQDAAAARSIAGVDGEALEALLVRRASDWAQRVAPGRVVTVADDADPRTRGERIATAAAEALDGLGAPLLIVSAAFPALGRAHDLAVLDDLASGCDFTLGPATTGDWFLLGLRTGQPALLEALVAGADGSGLMRAAALAGLTFGMLRSERPLRSVADADAFRADPLSPPELIAALGPGPNTI